MERPWYETFFDGDYQAASQAYFADADTPREVDAIWRLLALAPGQRVLDTVCGFGRHAIPLAERGAVVTGCDLSPRELGRARAASSASGAAVTWVECDMRALPFDAEFDAGYNVFTAWGYFEDDAENLRALAAFRRALTAGGRFLFDFLNVLGLAGRFRSQSWHITSDGTIVLREVIPDYRRGIIRDHLRFIAAARPPRESQTGVRMYTADVVCAMLERAGFRVERLLGDWDESEYSIDSRRLILACTAV